MQRRELLKGLSVVLGGGLSFACERALDVPEEARKIGAAAYDEAQQAIAHRVAELIIPATDTPGALEAGVGEFIDYVVTVWFNADEQSRFIAGLDDLQARAGAAGFVALGEAAQVELLESVAAQAAAQTGPSAAAPAPSFFAQIKELTVVGYYTSKVGATQELKYIPMPGYYDGHHKFEDAGRQWSI